jgi:hypothetical protein
MRVLLTTLFLGLSALGTLWNRGTFDPRAERKRQSEVGIAVLPRPEVMKLAALGFRSFLADWYWILGLNYFGDGRNEQTAFAQLAGYLDLAVALDPEFHSVYLYGGAALPWNRGDKWVNIESAASLLERGIQHFPDDWRLRFQLAYCYSAYLKRFKEAGDQLAAAARTPGAPPYLASLATRMYVTTGDVEGAQLMAATLVASVPDPKVRSLMEQRVKELRTLAEIKRLEAAVKSFVETKGVRPRHLDDLVEAKLIDRLPREPLGGQFLYDPETGEVNSSVLHDRLAIFIHPREQQANDGR